MDDPVEHLHLVSLGIAASNLLLAKDGDSQVDGSWIDDGF
jgi:hypothetical protein